MEQRRLVNHRAAQRHRHQSDTVPLLRIVPVATDALIQLNIACIDAMRAGCLVTPEGCPALALAQVQDERVRAPS